MSEDTASRGDRYADVDTSHFDDVEDGCGCTEIWEHISESDDRTAERESADAVDVADAVDPADGSDGTDPADGVEETEAEPSD